jgi:hypothetical protein
LNLRLLSLKLWTFASDVTSDVAVLAVTPSCLENLVAICHVIESHTLWVKSSHTHALHELSLLFKFFVSRKIFVLIEFSTLFYISA